MIVDLLRKLASHGWAYDQLQTLAGVRKVHEHLAHVLQELPRYETVIDLGGGTGLVYPLLRQTCRYTCVDLELPKLQRFRRRYKDGQCILGDVTNIPIRDQGTDLALCIEVAHHLDDSMFSNLGGEISRILRPGAILLFLDPIWNPSRRLGKALWRLDRGSYPRTPEQLLPALERHFNVVRYERITVYHQYLLVVGKNPLQN